MVKVKTCKYGRYIEGYITIIVTADIEDDDQRAEIPDEEALGMLAITQDDLAGSNDGSELIANATIQL